MLQKSLIHSYMLTYLPKAAGLHPLEQEGGLVLQRPCKAEVQLMLWLNGVLLQCQLGCALACDYLGMRLYFWIRVLMVQHFDSCRWKPSGALVSRRVTDSASWTLLLLS